MKKKVLVFTVILLFASLTGLAAAQGLPPMEQLGKFIFFDENLSIRDNQSCASCHAPMVGWTGPIPGLNKRGAVYFGSVRKMFGNRKPPAAAYATMSPRFDYDPDSDLFFGGNFWDGRATGWDLGNPAADQARGPFLNPLEQALPDKQAVVERVCSSSYASLFEAVWGPNACDDNVNENYDRIALSIAAYEASPEVNQFSSKYDLYLAGEVDLTEQEAWGLELFNGKGMCSECHPSEPGPYDEQPLFTDFTFDNLGVPKNPENPFYDTNPDFVDKGLGSFLRSLAAYDLWRSAPYVTPEVRLLDGATLSLLAENNDGKHKVPTLRNVDKRPGPGFVKSFGHNGYFKTLEGIVHFYNTRDVVGAGWPEPEVAENVNTSELGDLGLTPDEEAAIVAFLKTLSDGYMP